MAHTQQHTAGADNPMSGLLSAADLQRLVARHETEQMEHELHAHDAQDAAKKSRMDLLRQRRDLTPEMVQRAVQRWQTAASQGVTEVELLRFPSELCSDDGRAINNSEPDWPRTLVGVPAQLYEIWEQNLRDRGFKLKAYVVDFPDGKPGDIGMFLSWV